MTLTFRWGKGTEPLKNLNGKDSRRPILQQAVTTVKGHPVAADLRFLSFLESMPHGCSRRTENCSVLTRLSLKLGSTSHTSEG